MRNHGRTDFKNDHFMIELCRKFRKFDFVYVFDIISDITQTRVMFTCHPTYIMISGRQKFNGGFTRQIWYFSAAKFSIFPIFYRKWEFFTSGKIEFCENFKICSKFSSASIAYDSSDSILYVVETNEWNWTFLTVYWKLYQCARVSLIKGSM